MRLFKKKKKDTDYRYLLHKTNRFLGISILILVIIVLYQARTIKKYSAPVNTWLITPGDHLKDSQDFKMISDRRDNVVRERDFYNLARYVAENYDLKSKDAATKYNALLEVFTGPSEEMLIKNKKQIMNKWKSSRIDKVLTVPESIKVKIGKNRTEIQAMDVVSTSNISLKNKYLLHCSFEQIIVPVKGKITKKTRKIKILVKAVARKNYYDYYNDKVTKLGGWYYGLLIPRISDNINNI
jgi:hypothetical protein